MVADEESRLTYCNGETEQNHVWRTVASCLRLWRNKVGASLSCFLSSRISCAVSPQPLFLSLSLVLLSTLPPAPPHPALTTITTRSFLGETDITADRFVSVITSRQRRRVYYHGNEEPHLEEIGKNFINCCHGNFSISRESWKLLQILFFSLLLLGEIYFLKY